MAGTRVLNIPNLLSFGRLLLVPVFAVLILRGHIGWAIAVLMVSGFTDYLDGMLARRWGQTTRLGQMLDRSPTVSTSSPRCWAWPIARSSRGGWCCC